MSFDSNHVKGPVPDWKDREAERKKATGRLAVKTVAAIAVLIAAGWLIWLWAHDSAGVRRESPREDMIIPLPPPPPPEQQQPEPEPKPEEVAEPEPLPEPKPAEQPEPEEAPKPMDDMAKAMEMDAEAQAGTDSFNIGAGRSGGMSGSGGSGGVGNATYGQYLSYMFQQILRQDDSTRLLSYRLQVNVWFNEAGSMTRVELVRSSGNKTVDDAIIAALRRAPAMTQKPPKSLTLPVRVSLQGRRPS
ncbi:energy transducer TonB [Brenneria izadpanahii]|uniref:Energy transducer TonB n=1 Tax=Brenneria izadpanahii TaxID=2722756 RepID=A0ABX7UWJ4_9GAMM|nr:energy transducer TonB [Brenneria izadpanahii]QTF08707.1 energy transducer TonB [Brenneria izadpanahii]